MSKWFELKQQLENFLQRSVSRVNLKIRSLSEQPEHKRVAAHLTFKGNRKSQCRHGSIAAYQMEFPGIRIRMKLWQQHFSEKFLSSLSLCGPRWTSNAVPSAAPHITERLTWKSQRMAPEEDTPFFAQNRNGSPPSPLRSFVRACHLLFCLRCLVPGS